MKVFRNYQQNRIVFIVVFGRIENTVIGISTRSYWIREWSIKRSKTKFFYRFMLLGKGIGKLNQNKGYKQWIFFQGWMKCFIKDRVVAIVLKGIVTSTSLKSNYYATILIKPPAFLVLKHWWMIKYLFWRTWIADSGRHRERMEDYWQLWKESPKMKLETAGSKFE